MSFVYFASMLSNKSAPFPDLGEVIQRTNKKRKADALESTPLFLFKSTVPAVIIQLVASWIRPEDLKTGLLVSRSWNHLAKKEASTRLKREGYPQSLIEVVGSIRMICSEVLRVPLMWQDCLRLSKDTFRKSGRGRNESGSFFAHLQNGHETVIFTEKTKTGEKSLVYKNTYDNKKSTYERDDSPALCTSRLKHVQYNFPIN